MSTIASRSSAGARIVLGGKAQVYCIHDREKRQVTDFEHVRAIGRIGGKMPFDPLKDVLQKCACCENLFVTNTDVPMYCYECRQAPKHAAGGPLAEPTGERF